MKFNTIEEATSAIKNGEMIIVLDDEDRENEGDLVMAAEHVTPAAINFMAKYGRGIICTPITHKVATRLNLQFMTDENTSPHGTPFTISIDAIKGTTTGVSAFDRAQTIKKMMDEKSGPDDFIRPGHMFPLLAKSGGVLERPGHTEAAVDLTRLAGLKMGGVICEIMSEDGQMGRRDELFQMAQSFGLKIITIKDLIHYRKMHDPLILAQKPIDFQSDYGDFKLHLYQGITPETDNLTETDHIV